MYFDKITKVIGYFYLTKVIGYFFPNMFDWSNFVGFMPYKVKSIVSIIVSKILDQLRV